MSNASVALNKDDVVQRLKAAAEKEVLEEYQEGKQAGRRWAEEEATPKELGRLEAHLGPGPGRGFSGGGVNPAAGADALVFALWPKAEGDGYSADELWEQILAGDAGRARDPDFRRGFGDGALELWREVKAEL
jgi:hypothetical protein